MGGLHADYRYCRRSSRSSWGENIAEWSHSIGNELRK